MTRNPFVTNDSLIYDSCKVCSKISTGHVVQNVIIIRANERQELMRGGRGPAARTPPTPSVGQMRCTNVVDGMMRGCCLLSGHALDSSTESTPAGSSGVCKHDRTCSCHNQPLLSRRVRSRNTKTITDRG